MVDLVLIAVLILVIISFRKQPNNEDYLSLDKCNCLRGILAIFIVLHHMSERISEGHLFPQLQHLGYLIVAVFFFLSGYGLMQSYRKKGKEYFKGYWKNRIGYLLIVYLLVSILYLVFFNLIDKDVSLVQFARSFINGYPIATFSWYIIAQIYFYILFWIVFRLFDKFNNSLKILIILCLTLVSMVAIYYAGYDSYWYLSDIAFVVGIAYSEYKNKIDKLLSNHYIISLILCFGCFTVFSIMPSIMARINIEGEWIYPLCRNISSAAFALIIVVVFFKLSLKSKLWSFLGHISLEIYLIHGMVITILSYFIKNNLLLVIVTVVTSVTMAYVMSLLNKQISKLLKGKKNGK